MFAGDVEPRGARKAALDARFGALEGPGGTAPRRCPAPRDRPAGGGRLVLVAPAGRAADGAGDDPPGRSAGDGAPGRRATCLTTLFGGTFTSRLMQNIREKHGYSYGARSEIADDGNRLPAHRAVRRCRRR